MKPPVLAARLGLVALILLTAFALLKLSRAADTQYAQRRHWPAARAALGGDVAAPDAAWRLTLLFDRPYAPAGVLQQGWSGHEAGSGVWSSGQLAALRLPAPAAAREMRITLTVDPFIAPDVPMQRVRLRVGGRTLGEWRLVKAGRTELAVTAPADASDPAGGLLLELDLPDAATPAKPGGGGDQRMLAIKLLRVSASG